MRVVSQSGESSFRALSYLLNTSAQNSTTGDRALMYRYIWLHRIVILKQFYLPIIYSFDNTVPYTEITSEYEAKELFSEYNVYIDIDTSPLGSNLIDCSDFFVGTDLEFPEEGILPKGFYESYAFKMWFTHVYLLCEPTYKLGNINNEKYMLRVLAYTFYLTLIDNKNLFKIDI